jgi:hypothetical protein
VKVLRAIEDFVIGDDRVTALIVVAAVALGALAARAGVVDDELLLVLLAAVVIGAVGLRVTLAARRG